MEVIERNIVNQDGLTLVFVVTVLVFGILSKAFSNQFYLFLRVPISNSYFRQQRKSNNILDGFSTLVSFAGALIIALSAYVYVYSAQFTSPSITTFDWVFFIQLLTGCAVFLTLKYVLEKIVSEVFNINEFMDKYLTFKLGDRNFCAFVILPLMAVAVYFTNYNNVFISVILGGFIVFQIVLLLNFYLKKRKLITRHLFYFILYLCTFEIAPYFILYKMLA